MDENPFEFSIQIRSIIKKERSETEETRARREILGREETKRGHTRI